MADLVEKLKTELVENLSGQLDLAVKLETGSRLPTGYAQYTPPTPTRRNYRVASRRRCVHEFATSWRQFRRVVGVKTHPSAVVTHRLQYCKLGHGRRLRCALAIYHCQTSKAKNQK